MSGPRTRLPVLALSAVLGAGLGAVLSQPAEQPTVPVCHSAAEDAPIYDCDYRAGGWYPKR